MAAAAIDIALGSVERIIKVVAEVKQAVETAKRNKDEVVDILERVETVEHIVLVLDETDVTTNLSMDRALENLHRALHRALELVQDCEKKNRVCLLCAAQDLSKQLLRVQDDISHKLMQVTLAVTVHITIELGKTANPPRRRRRQHLVGRMRHRPHDAATAVHASCASRTRWPPEDEGQAFPEVQALPMFGDWNVGNPEPDSTVSIADLLNRLGVTNDILPDFWRNSSTGDGESGSDGCPNTPPKHDKVNM